MKELTNEQQLELISQMIVEAKAGVAKGGSSHILLWGWVIAIANFSHFALEQIGFYAPFFVWLIMIPTTFVSIYMSRKLRNQGASGHLDSVYGQVWLAVGISIVIILLMMGSLQMFHNPVILCLAAVGMFVTGRLLKYTPVIIGAIVLWVAALIEWQVEIEYHFLISGIAIVIGYLIPGYMLKRTQGE